MSIIGDLVVDAKKTSLASLHERMGASMVDFHGWLMPIQYGGILKEHEAVRTGCGIFDASHMGEIMVEGRRAADLVNHISCNRMDVEEGKCVYSPMCREDGGIIDDLIACRLSKDKYLLVVNSSNTETDYKWIKDNNKFDLKISDVSASFSLIAIQGPESEKILQKTTSHDLKSIKRFRLAEDVEIMGVKSIVSRTGYTGEDGFEIYAPWDDGPKIFGKLAELGATPCGLGARDTLRLEKGYMLYGNDINLDTTPIEAGLAWTIDFEKDFIGRDALLRQKNKGVSKMLVGFKCIEKAVPRQGYEIKAGGETVGKVTSGNMSPTLKEGVGMGYVKTEYAKTGEINIMIRGKEVDALVVKPPFV